MVSWAFVLNESGRVLINIKLFDTACEIECVPEESRKK